MTESTERLAKLVLALSNSSALGDTVAATRSGRMDRCSGSSTLTSIASGRTGVASLLRDLVSIWSTKYATLCGSGFSDLLEAIGHGIAIERQTGPRTEVVWTGPTVAGSYLRATRQVVQDIIQSASSELLVVGYWIAGKGDVEGIINDVIDQVGDAVRRGVKVTLVLDRGEKGYGKNNRDTLLELWPPALELPKILTWAVPEQEKHLKLHAKVLVADRADALVTSANLTMHALDRNMEMGVRIIGNPAKLISEQFRLLGNSGVLVDFKL